MTSNSNLRANSVPHHTDLGAKLPILFFFETGTGISIQNRCMMSDASPQQETRKENLEKIRGNSGVGI
jgi:hypothetical protein